MNMTVCKAGLLFTYFLIMFEMYMDIKIFSRQLHENVCPYLMEKNLQYEAFLHILWLISANI